VSPFVGVNQFLATDHSRLFGDGFVDKKLFSFKLLYLSLANGLSDSLAYMVCETIILILIFFLNLRNMMYSVCLLRIYPKISLFLWSLLSIFFRFYF
jgi:hypothetical protein